MGQSKRYGYHCIAFVGILVFKGMWNRWRSVRRSEWAWGQADGEVNGGQT